MKCPSYHVFFSVISPKTRLKIIEALKQKPMSVTEISKELNEEQSNISHNLKKLINCNLVDVKKHGKQRIYSLNKETMLPMMNLVEKHVKKYCCKTCAMKK